jgi:hypothetical protein
MKTYGINIGNSWVKAVAMDRTGKETVMPPFPAQIASATEQEAGGIGNATPVFIDRRRYWIGDDAHLGTPIRKTSQERFTDPVFLPALMAGIAQRMEIEAGVAITSLPAAWVNEQNGHELGQRIREGLGTNVFHRIVAISEPLAALFSIVIDEHGRLIKDESLTEGHVGIVDIGGGTLDVSVVNALSLKPGSVHTWSDLGMQTALTSIRTSLNTTFRTRLSLTDTDLVVRERTIKVRGSRKPLPLDWDYPLRELARGIVGALEDVWGDGGDLDCILIAGGGAREDILVQAIQHRYHNPDNEVFVRSIPDSQNAIARGCARRAQMIVAKMAQSQAA